MTFGIQGFTDNGSLLFTSEDKCLHLVGVATRTTTTEYASLYTILSYECPVVLARMNVGDLLCISDVDDLGGGVWQMQVIGPQHASATLLCYATLTSAALGSGFGLRVFDAAGAVTFDTTRNPLWLSEIYTQYGASIPVSSMVVPWGRSYVYPACTVYAASQSTPGPGAAGGIYFLGIQRTATGHVYAWTTAFRGTAPKSPSTSAFYVNHSVFVIETNGIL